MAFAVVALALAGAIWLLAQQQAPRNYGYRVMNTFPHDPTAYTQGLVFRDGFLFEGTGKHGQSSLRRVELESGRVVQSHSLARELFGEGITIFGDRIYQLTWRNGIAIVYDKESFRELKRLRYEGEGWGLTDDGTHLIMSDGSATLRFVDPEDFQVVRRLLVHSQGRRVDQLNELEYINGEIFANIWYRDHIARISPKTGEVTGWIDLRGLWPKRRDRDDVLNGIAYDAENDRLFVTGKNWPRLYEIQLAPR
jgi:glutaminyl-peptide cyclotransferase